MSGKAYSLREMKSVVDYLTANNLYGETRGRKMWTDFANSNLTTRTWQSLKETFLKRILPDISNPYYRLDADQIMSFKRGYTLDLTQKDKKLTFVSVNESIENVANGANEQPSTSKNNNEANATGEDIQCSKIVHDRASTETLILDTCYETAEDIQRDLESTDEDKRKSTDQDREKTKDKSKHPLKSVRDFIEYSEPLTPMLQEVLDDFATDEDCSDTEPPMQIDENYVAQEEITDTPENAPASQSILTADRTENQGEHTTAGAKNNVEETSNEKPVTKHNEESVKPTDETVFSQLEDVMVLVDEALANDLDKELNTQKEESQNIKAHSHESSSALIDTLLPNNQEAVESATFGINSPVLPTPNVNARHGNKKEEAQVNTVSDEEHDKIDVEDPIEIDSNDEKTTDKEPPKQKPKMTLIIIQHTTQNTEASRLKSPSKLDHSDDQVHEIHSDSSTSNKEVTSQVDNPCLQSVSLYEEQMVTTKYSDSDSNNKENSSDKPNLNDDQDKNEINKNVNQKNETKQNQDQKNETKENQDQKNETKENQDQNNGQTDSEAKTTDKVILLNSRTTSESFDDSVSDKPLARSSLIKQKDKKLASVFGFSNGGVAKSRRFGGRKRTTSHRSIHSHYSGSDSSGWTSTSDSEYVSPPRGRRNKYARKYLKPHSARIMSLEEEGGLFVMLGKKIYPLVKDGQVVKNYVSYLPESDPEEDESYWKSKYIDERKRTAELKRKLGQFKSNGVLHKEEKESSVSISSPVSEKPPRVPPCRQESINDGEIVRRDSEVVAKPSNQETLKIKFIKNDQEVQLEGHWQHINPVLAQVVSILHKESSEAKRTETVTCVELSSGVTTPVVTPTVTSVTISDKGVHDKINEMESEIFKEIEEKDAPEVVVEQPEDEPQEQNEENNTPIENTVEENVAELQVTQRRKRGRPKKEATPPEVAGAQSVAKKQKKSIVSSKTNNLETIKAQEIKDSTPNVAKLTRSPRKLLNGITQVKRTRKSTAKVQPDAPIETPETPATEDPDNEVRYKFPSPVPERRASETSNTNKNSPKKHLPNITSPDSTSHHSVNSSQGYQDSDTSPFIIGMRKRRRLSISSLSIKGRKIHRKNRSKSYPLLKHISCESSNSSFNISTRRGQSTINSEVYKSESYQLLMPRTKAIIKQLERIEETNSNDNLMDRIRNLRDDILRATNNPTNVNEPASSSNLSLPLSPELSIVENLSISKSVIAGAEDYPTINEIQDNTALNTCNNKYLLSEVDVSMPLMAQNCALQESYRKHLMSALSNLSDNPNSAGRNLSNDSSMKVSMTSESILKSMSAVNMASDSLDRRLEQLLLESAQKPANQNKEQKMEVDTQEKKKSGSRTRCSTPHKKKTVQNKRKSSEEPIIEEESRAHCSRGGRRSCPPTINIVYYEDDAPDNLQINIQDESINVTTVTKSKRVKKDIIKVKIGRPKDKPKKSKSKNKTPNVSQSPGNTEGDNESGVFLQAFEDSGDLIHNHSETCLQIKDCMSDSVEFIETAIKSIISLDSSSFTAENKENSNGSLKCGKLSPELFCGNARCATHLGNARAADVRSVDSANTVYFTPIVSRCNSLLTEDLSDQTPASKSPVKRASNWYLLSDEESNTNYFDVQDSNDAPSYGANLKQLFPIACAVPDLSTITEMSERNENSQRTS